PGVFIPIAEQINLMDSIGEFVLREACSFASGWKTIDMNAPPRIAVNVSPQQLRNVNFIDLVRQTLSDTGVEPAQLELEITEEVLVHDFDEVKDMLMEIRDLGVSIAVDDFGSGQTSLRYLNQFPISKLKIDRSFIKNLGVDEKAEEITRSMVDLGRRLGVSVLAEGVEEESQLRILKLWNCDQVQGFLFSKPFAESTVVEYLNQLSNPLRKSA
ncbi:MAG: EAL domain-containing protein, partial [Pseudomonadota bacterium]